MPSKTKSLPETLISSVQGLLVLRALEAPELVLDFAGVFAPDFAGVFAVVLALDFPVDFLAAVVEVFLVEAVVLALDFPVDFLAAVVEVFLVDVLLFGAAGFLDAERLVADDGFRDVVGIWLLLCIVRFPETLCTAVPEHSLECLLLMTNSDLHQTSSETAQHSGNATPFQLQRIVAQIAVDATGQIRGRAKISSFGGVS
jgi:hypothetical protein